MRKKLCKFLIYNLQQTTTAESADKKTRKYIVHYNYFSLFYNIVTTKESPDAVIPQKSRNSCTQCCPSVLQRFDSATIHPNMFKSCL